MFFPLVQLAELGNFYSHLILSWLRTPGTRERKIPRGFLFELVSSPNYLCESLGWLAFLLLTHTFAGMHERSSVASMLCAFSTPHCFLLLFPFSLIFLGFINLSNVHVGTRSVMFAIGRSSQIILKEEKSCSPSCCKLSASLCWRSAMMTHYNNPSTLTPLRLAVLFSNN